MPQPYSSTAQFFAQHTPHALLEQFGSPLYVYNEHILRLRAQEMRSLIQHPRFTVSYSTKANSNPHLLTILREEGLVADAMSPGELAILQRAGFTKEEICYVSNNISQEELAFAAAQAHCVSVDSIAQLELLGKAAPGASVMLRLNPGIGAGHHQKVTTAGAHTKFGIWPEELDLAKTVVNKYRLSLIGLNQHVGSLFMDPTPYIEAVRYLLKIAEDFPELQIIDFGGGFGVPYHKASQEPRLDLHSLGQQLTSIIDSWCMSTGYQGAFYIEPGRYVVAECGVLLGSVFAIKQTPLTRYVGTDLGFSVLMRPVLYNAFHEIDVYPASQEKRELCKQSIVGNICETGDVLAPDRLLPEIHEKDVLAVLDAGAYGMSMASNYNQRLRPAEVLIGLDGEARLIRKREQVEDMLRLFV